MIDRPETPEEMRDLFIACADVVRLYGKGGVPMTSLALSFGVVWTEFTDEQAARFFDELVAMYQDPEAPLAEFPRRMAHQRAGRPRRFRAWFS